MTHRNAIKPDRRPSVITTINTGFNTVNRHLWIVLVPLVLDLFFWLGPRISPQPLAGNLLQQLPQVPEWFTAGIEQRQALNMPYDLRNDGGFLNFVNPLVGSISVPRPPMPQATWHIGSIALLVGTLVAINLLGLLLSAVYWLLLVDAVRGGRPTAGMRRIWQLFTGMAGVVVVWLGIALLVTVPFILIGSLSAFVSQALGVTVIALGIALILWMMFTAQFAFDALAMSEVKPTRALLGSVLLVRRWFWSAIGLFALSSIIVSGLRVVWQGLASLGPVGLVVAMLGSGYIGTGLAAAHLVFYRDRVQPAATVAERR